MVKRDLSSGLPRGGTRHVEIGSVELKRSKKNDQMLVVELRDAETREKLCSDFWMLEGKGAWSGNKKLEAFGMDPRAEEFDEIDLVGRRGYAALVAEDHPDYGPQLKVDGKAEDSFAGYWPDDEPPLGYGASPIASIDADSGPVDPSDTPF